MNSRIRWMLAFLVLAACPPPFSSHAADGELRGKCGFQFFVTSSMHDFTGSGACREFVAPLERAPGGELLLPRVELSVPVSGMETGNGKRDRDMRKMFQADRYPEIHASLRGVDADAIRRRMREDPGGKSRLDVILVIRDAERQIPAVVSDLKEEGNRVSFQVEFPVSLEDFGIERPGAFGIVRVGDRVLVKASFSVDLQEMPR